MGLWVRAEKGSLPMLCGPVPGGSCSHSLSSPNRWRFVLERLSMQNPQPWAPGPAVHRGLSPSSWRLPQLALTHRGITHEHTQDGAPGFDSAVYPLEVCAFLGPAPVLGVPFVLGASGRLLSPD